MKRLALALALIASPVIAEDDRSPSPEGAEIYFIGLSDGDSVTGPVTIRFGLRGMGIAPAGIEQSDTGHHHLFLNRAKFGESEAGDDEMTAVVPSDDNHLHFGGGQTEVTLDLSAGEHTLQLVLGDHFHIPHNPPVVSEQITIVVE